jgi:hypothetical protein
MGLRDFGRGVAEKVRKVQRGPSPEEDVLRLLGEVRAGKKLSRAEKRETSLLERQLRAYKRGELLGVVDGMTGSREMFSPGDIEVDGFLRNYYLLGRYRDYKPAAGELVERRLVKPSYDGEEKRVKSRNEFVLGGVLLHFLALRSHLARGIIGAKARGQPASEILEEHVLPAAKLAYLFGQYSIKGAPTKPPSKLRQWFDEMLSKH